MNTGAIREKLHQFIDQVEDKRAKAIYELFEEEIEQEALPYSDEFKAALDKRINYYQNGGTMVSPQEMHKRLINVKNGAA